MWTWGIGVLSYPCHPCNPWGDFRGAVRMRISRQPKSPLPTRILFFCIKVRGPLLSPSLSRRLENQTLSCLDVGNLLKDHPRDTLFFSAGSPAVFEMEHGRRARSIAPRNAVAAKNPGGGNRT